MYLINLLRGHVTSGGFFRHLDVSEYRQRRPSVGVTRPAPRGWRRLPGSEPDGNTDNTRIIYIYIQAESLSANFGNVEPPVGGRQG